MTNPTTDLNVAILPLDIKQNDVDSNLCAVETAIAGLKPNTDMIVLPEMFSTGFTTDKKVISSVAESNHGKTITRLRELSTKNGIAIWGGFVAKEGADFFNRGFMICADGSIEFYDKRHLFRMGGEREVFTSGHSRSPIVNIKGWKLAMAICYDIRFPAWNRNLNLKYDALIVPANWAHSRLYAWKQLLIARAIENQAYVVGCNRSGTDEFGEYPLEDSFAFNHWGKEISEADPSGILYCEFNAAQLIRDRERFCPWRDADKFEFTDN